MNHRAWQPIALERKVAREAEAQLNMPDFLRKKGRNMAMGGRLCRVLDLACVTDPSIGLVIGSCAHLGWFRQA